MSILTKAFQTLAVLLSYLLLSMVLISCSEEDNANKIIYDHPHAETTDMEKHLFEHEFAQQCIAKETANLVNKEAGRERFAEPCLCIAIYLFKDLAAKESYTLLNDKQHAQSLRNKFEEAANHCFV